MVTYGTAIALLALLVFTAPLERRAWTKHWGMASAFFFIVGMLTLLKDVFR